MRISKVDLFFSQLEPSTNLWSPPIPQSARLQKKTQTAAQKFKNGQKIMKIAKNWPHCVNNKDIKSWSIFSQLEPSANFSWSPPIPQSARLQKKTRTAPQSTFICLLAQSRSNLPKRDETCQSCQRRPEMLPGKL